MLFQVRDYMAQLGFKTMKEMIGQTQCIRQCDIPLNEKTKVWKYTKKKEMDSQIMEHIVMLHAVFTAS